MRCEASGKFSAYLIITNMRVSCGMLVLSGIMIISRVLYGLNDVHSAIC